jgi:hypothetical protein
VLPETSFERGFSLGGFQFSETSRCRITPDPAMPKFGKAFLRHASRPDKSVQTDSWLDLVLFDPLVGEPVTPAKSSALQYIASVSGSHSHAKSVRGLLVPLVGLVSSFHSAVLKFAPSMIPESGSPTVEVIIRTSQPRRLHAQSYLALLQGASGRAI